MTAVLINPGAGPVAGARYHFGCRAIRVFIQELRIGRVECRCVGYDRADGRATFRLRQGHLVCDVDMPCVPLTKLKRRHIWQPRLYVDGSSWYWHFALGIVRMNIHAPTALANYWSDAMRDVSRALGKARKQERARLEEWERVLG